MSHAASPEGMLLVPETPGLDWGQQPGPVRCDAPLQEGLAALSAALEDGSASAPDAIPHLHRQTIRSMSQ